MKKYLAEFFGTFTLSFLVYLSVAGQFPIATPLLAALCLTTFVYTIGGISGAHINPAVTFGLFVTRKMKLDETIKYIISQLLGAGLALALINIFQLNNSVLTIEGGYKELFAEMLGTMMLTFGISSVIYNKAPGFVIGGSLLLGISISVLIGSAGILNPAVALALGAFNPAYLLGQLFGSILGFVFYQYLLELVPTKKKSN